MYQDFVKKKKHNNKLKNENLKKRKEKKGNCIELPKHNVEPEVYNNNLKM